MTSTALHPAATTTPVPQYTRAGVLAVWAAAAVPMGLLSWVVAPMAADHLTGPLPFARALIAAMTVGLAWQFLLVAGLVARERRRGEIRGIRVALWLQAPSDPSTGRHAPRAWWWLVPLLAGSALVQLLPAVPIPAARDLGTLLGSPDGRTFFHGNWTWFAVVVALALLNTVLGEELLFRGFLLPRMSRAFGRSDWIANGLLFAIYHVHQPWSVPSALIDTVVLAWPSRRWRSAWFGIVVHSGQSVLFVTLTLLLVLGS